MFELSIVTPEKKIIEKQEMEEVFVPAYRGELDILPGHAPLVSTLTEGVLKYRLKDQSELKAVAISWGYVEVTPQGVNILAETAEAKSEIDLERAKKSLQDAENSIESDEATPETIEKYQHKRKRAEARIEVAEKY
jgi:F-type H+-transporting ATPase subunit epsilon